MPSPVSFQHSQINSDAPFNLSELKSRVPDNPFYLEGEPSYEDVNVYYNRALESTPQAIIRPKSESDVSKIVAFCPINGIKLAVRSGGHDFSGRSTISDGIVLDMRDIDFVNIAPDNTRASVGGGIISGPLQQALEEQGFFTPTGQAKTVGYVSWACGGGYGFYVGSYGFGVDQILGARVVLADGSHGHRRRQGEFVVYPRRRCGHPRRCRRVGSTRLPSYSLAS